MSDDVESEEYELTWKDDPLVCKWRRDEARAAGLTDVEAKLFSECRDFDIMELRHCIKRGATLAQIRGVLFGSAFAFDPQSQPDHAHVAG